MSVKAMSWVFEHSPYAGITRLVHLALADVANDAYDFKLWLRNEDVQRKAKASESQVRRAIQTLRKDGFIELLDAGGGRGKASVYRLTFPEGCHDDTVSLPERVSSDAEKGVIEDPERVSSEHPRFLLTQEVLKGTQERDAALEPLFGFDEFWTTYPKRNGKRVGRAATERLWARLSLEDKRAAYRGARHLAAAVDADLTLPKDPERFLKHRCWEDWQEPATPAPRREPLRRHTKPLEHVIASAANGRHRQPLPIPIESPGGPQ